MQKIAVELRPGSLDNLGLASALEHEAQRFQQRTGIACQVKLPAEGLTLPAEGATAVFRIFQEALTNVARHAQATEVRGLLQSEADHLILQIEDNGRGIRPEALSDKKSLGLLGMRERAAVLGGEVAIAPLQPSGTRVTLRLPRTANENKFWAEL